MDFFQAVEKRVSYRGPFSEGTLATGDLQKILDAAWRAPSGRNLQTVRIVAVTEKTLIEQIAGIIEKPILKNAPAILLFLMESKAVFAIEDCSAAVENALLAITALGYSSCWIDGALRRDNRADRIAELLHVPSKYQARILLPVGEAAETPLGPDKRPMNEIVFMNRFGNPL